MMPFFNIGDITIHYQQQGTGDLPIICVHPPCIPSVLFADLCTELADEQCMIRFDIRGHGKSEPGQARLTLALIAEDIKVVLEQCGAKQAFLCGYGAGSFPVIKALNTYPDRFCGGILISGAESYKDLRSRSKLQATFISSVLKKKAPIAKQAAKMETEDRLMSHLLYEAALQGDQANWMEYASACLDAALEHDLRHIKQPMLLLYGADDPISQYYSEQMYRQLPNAELYRIVDAERELLLKEPLRTAFVMRQWLAKLQHPELIDTYEERSELVEELVSHGIAEAWNELDQQNYHGD